MFDVFDKFATDEKKEVSGTEVVLEKGVSLLIARADNINFLKLIQKEADDIAEKTAGMNEEDAYDLDRKSLLVVLAKTVLLGWKGLSYKGRPIKYSEDNAVMLLGHKDFRKLVMQHASDFANFKAKLEDADEKN